MSMPAGVSTCTVTLSRPLSTLGTAGEIVDAQLRADRTIVWDATGETLYAEVEQLAPNDVTGVLSFDVPHVDQTGFLDVAGAEVEGWSYLLTYRVRLGSALSQPISKPFQVVVGQDAIDADELPSGVSIPPSGAPIPGVTSVAGVTGSVTTQDLLDALEAGLLAKTVTEGSLGLVRAPGLYTVGIDVTGLPDPAQGYSGGTMLVVGGTDIEGTSNTVTSRVFTQVLEGGLTRQWFSGYNLNDDGWSDWVEIAPPGAGRTEGHHGAALFGSGDPDEFGNTGGVQVVYDSGNRAGAAAQAGSFGYIFRVTDENTLVIAQVVDGETEDAPIAYYDGSWAFFGAYLPAPNINSSPLAIACTAFQVAELTQWIKSGSTVAKVTKDGDFMMQKVGFNGTEPIAKPNVAGSRGGNAALASLLTALANLGLITNSTTA